MRILYDGQIYSICRNRGINRYFQNIIQNLPSEFTPAITTNDGSNSYPVHSNLKLYYCSGKETLPKDIYSWYEKVYFRTVALLGQFNIVHPTYYMSVARCALSSYHSRLRYPVVLTVHDLFPEIFPEQLDPSGQQRFFKQEAILAAQAIICVSENTKRDLIKYYSIPEQRIKVTHLASSIDATLSYGAESVPSNPYYIYVGGREFHKNFDRCLQAFAKAVSIQPDLFLCVAGAPFKLNEQKLIAELGLEQQILHYEYPSDNHLAKLYRCSIGLIYPSLYEGFGIPPLEAMSCGTAVITSNNSSLPEVVGNAGIMFDPASTADLTEILLWLLDCPIERECLIKKGYERAKLFSWEETAAKTIEVYASVAE
ncbi:glycosyltransferase family 1 protein [Leptolyngbya sp. FACHB-711]|uniref:glycosyltransferase family 4 protein n=1 Tax=Leptolyngbya sp. FACHB-711 TaxID=2692813 RepID=UPI001683E79E|nr:glycosyltransferase family 1 protein [Leptolyngbya sp. FACHB-711]MBD2028218.1 glycosyltransferase family 4 protein [Leptolyngbya sp. FACHB-711]